MPVARVIQSFPLDRAGRLTRNIIHHAVDAGHLVRDTAGDLFQQIIRDPRPVGGHEVVGRHGTQRDQMLIGAMISHHADRFHVGQYRKELRQLLFVAGHYYINY